MDGGHVMDDEIPATPSVDEAIRALREYAQFEPQTRVMVWTPALATLVADALEAAARPAAGSSSLDVAALAEQMGLADDPFFAREYHTNVYVHALMHLAEAQAARITELEDGISDHLESLKYELDYPYELETLLNPPVNPPGGSR